MNCIIVYLTGESNPRGVVETDQLSHILAYWTPSSASWCEWSRRTVTHKSDGVLPSKRLAWSVQLNNSALVANMSSVGSLECAKSHMEWTWQPKTACTIGILIGWSAFGQDVIGYGCPVHSHLPKLAKFATWTSNSAMTVHVLRDSFSPQILQITGHERRNVVVDGGGSTWSSCCWHTALRKQQA